jgi:disulfide bond formation protein DsbB
MASVAAFAALTTRFSAMSPRVIGALALAVAGSALGLAVASEYWGGLLPCSLCLMERWPYRIAMLSGALAVVAPRPAIRPLLWLIVLVMLANVGLAAVHVGVEQHLWQNPINECAAPHLGGTLLDRLLQLSSRPPMPCDRGTYLIPFVPLSMAAMNALYAAGCAVLLALYLLHGRFVSPSCGRESPQPIG